MKPRKIKLHPPAKINLFLKIIGQRTDGYHEIKTLVTLLTLEDTLHIGLTPGRGIVLACNDPALPCGRTNLAFIAAKSYLEAVGSSLGVRITLEKRIPIASGLGGGSSDAAFVLLALDILHSHSLRGEVLHSIAASIGSDVPFFLRRRTAWCHGRGEILEAENFRCFENRTAVLVKPPFPVETSWAYQSWANARKIPGFLYCQQPSPWSELYNDLEVPVFEKFPLLGLIKQWLLSRQETEFALMSGSGPTLFAILRQGASSHELETAAASELGDDLWVHTCKVQLPKS
ncbi:4-diphosphocytidyl-2-C-methyl-D-erythritol kinase [Candidatus Xiphinematobacter sp. Idaho Grape]|uniref:4-(cytidine 5'-diphospho)-2-C-methyl-D-erythritol kinase n=1 Tax=Candidatus Xiphinematobacter sp. Idaho Grape TaxID=1704307 RepID=UPI000706470B|nr:4-(cytidine 5'-diphospho)-2-C-methyl-D-erythritol kinase [Candidatus Xiphinematobacter sp. Idaho Grape]ALJ56381.1 4-diphosphocytidyl-2-C-methyl-D-erythritol kinase [Candidatus Xiphinematobacter sp. Idaho Grape]